MRVLAITHTDIKELENQINDFLSEHDDIEDIKFSSGEDSIEGIVYSALIIYNE